LKRRALNRRGVFFYWEKVACGAFSGCAFFSAGQRRDFARLRI
jgi:hypothetical protein